jgi:hypothetical protein
MQISGQMSKPRLTSRLFGFLTVFLAAAGTMGILLRMHDYPQTVQSLVEVKEGRSYSSFLPVFYFFNEAGSGLKYSLTGNPRHFRFFPTLEFIREKRLEFIGRMLTNAVAGNWCAQLKVSSLYAGAKGYELDSEKANRWFTLAYIRAQEQPAPEAGLFIHELKMFEKTFGVAITKGSLEWARDKAKRLSGSPLGCQVSPSPTASPTV